MVKEFELDNNIHVIYEYMPYVRSVSLGVWIKVGSSYENKKQNGISHMIEHMLFKGTKNRTAKQIADETAILGGNLNAYTGKECTAYYLKTLDEQLEHAMDLISDMIKNPVFLQEHIETEKQVIIDEISMYNDSCEDMVHEKLQKKVWKDHPLGYIISGKKKIVKGYTQDEIVQYWKKHYVGKNMILSIAGNFSEDTLLNAIKIYFSDIPAGDVKDDRTTPEYTIVNHKKYRAIEQVHLDIAFPGIKTDSELRYPFAIANSILGGSVSSRLFQKIREELGRAYTIYSYGSNFKNAGLWQIYATTTKEQLNQSIEEIYNEIKNLKDNGITEQELIQAKDELRSEMIIGNESSQSRMDYNAKSILSYNRYIPLETAVQELMAVTKEDVELFMKENIDIEKSSICVMGNYL